MGKPVIFISYSHVDEEWKDRLAKHLSVLQNQEALAYWDDRKLHIGDAWQSEIKTVLTSAQAAILLISVDFLTSKFICSEEVPPLLQRRRSDGMQIFPLIIRSCP